MALEDYSLDELIDEVMRRSDIGIISLMDLDEREGDAIRRQWVGNTHTCIGLAQDMCYVLMRHFDGNATVTSR